MRSFPNDCGETSHKHSSRWFFEAIHACVRARVSVWACGCARVSERGREREGANKIIRVNRWLCNVACRALRSPHLVESRQLSEEEPMKFEGVVWGLFQKNDGSLFFSSSSKLSVLTRFFAASRVLQIQIGSIIGNDDFCTKAKRRKISVTTGSGGWKKAKPKNFSLKTFPSKSFFPFFSWTTSASFCFCCF